MIPPQGPGVPEMLRENTFFSSEGILASELSFSREAKDVGNISDKGCARDHSG